MKMRDVFLLVALVSLATAVDAQVPVSRLILPNETGRTGVFRIPAGAADLQVQAEIRNTDGRLISPARCPVRWQSADPAILSIERTTEGSAWVRSVSEGITTLSASFSCAPDANASIPVAVGSAAIDRPFAAADSLDNFYPRSLNVTVPGWARVSGGKVFFRPIDQGIQFVGSAYNGNDALITPYEFPMRWRVDNPSILKLDTAYDHTAFFTPAGKGTTRVTFAVEGLSQSFDVAVQDENPPTNEDHSTLALVSGSTAPVGATLPQRVTIETATRTISPVTTGSSAGTTTTATSSTATATPIIRDGSTLTAVDPAAVHATGFTAISGYGNIQLKWNPAPGAVGYRLSREAWDPAQQRFVTAGSARIPSAIGPDEVGSSADLLSESTYLDGSLDPALQYVYVLSTYFRTSKGTYYYPDRASEPRATATPKNASSMSWLPADWQAPPKLTNVQIVSQAPGGKSTITYLVEWQPKGGAAGYIVSIIESSVAFERDSKVCGSRPRPLLVSPTRPGTWYITLGNRVQHSSTIEIPAVNIKEGILDASPGVCVQVRAVYPNKVNSAGTPDVIDAFYTEITGPGPESRFQVLSNAVISADAAAMFWAPEILAAWEIVPPDLIKKW
jgi:hypothetical protein